jgi:hypothetical protein
VRYGKIHDDRRLAMTAPPQLEMRDGYALFRVAGDASLHVLVERVNTAIAYAKAQRITRLLIDTTGVTGLVPPTLAERFYLAKTWAETAGSGLRFALVVRPELSDPRRFGATVATNRGADTQSFDTEAEALVWLRRP